MAEQTEAPQGPTGLVHLSTSGTVIALDPTATRFRRMKAGVITAARLMQQQHQTGGFRYRVAMLTTTYRPDAEWSPRHISELMRLARQWMQRRGHRLKYVWVCELTRAGIPHYHVLIWLPRGLTLPKPDKKGWWKYGYTKIEWARNAVGYVAKYATKGGNNAGEFPRGCRLHSCGGLNSRSAAIRRWWLSPGWLRERFSSADDLRRAVGGGWVSRRTGDHVESPWGVCRLNGVYVCYLKEGMESC